MFPLPASLFLSSDVRELDRIVIEEKNIPGITLMERAGMSAWEDLKQNWPDANRIIVICGAGNNAGDGYILARHAFEEGFQTTVMYLSHPDDLKGDAHIAYERLIEKNHSCEKFNGEALENADVIVDAIFGTGLSREVSGEYKQAIDAINCSSRPVIALDVPSGLNADTGAILGCAINAEITTTFIGIKAGLMTNEGPGCCGNLHFSALDIPDDVYAEVPEYASRIDANLLSNSLKRRARNAHKGSFGHVLVVGGDYGFAGSVRITAEAALRTGAGLVTVATRPEHAAGLSLSLPEVMARGVSTVADLSALIEKASVIAIGPGLGQDEWGMNLLSRVIESELALVVDADALNLIALEKFACSRWILTPHPGEAARLSGMTAGDIQNNRYECCKNMQKIYDGVVVLKGCGTVICDKNSELSVCSDGNPGMASGGMGDCLTGVIAALLAQGYPQDVAAKVGVCLHAAAADKASANGERGLIATDLMPWIRYLANP
jgi:hydroxyethylthiazole kinase-like uncharacterized protein yjeF